MPSPSKIVNEQGKNYYITNITLSRIYISTTCILPIIFYVPTPDAIPLNLVSTNLIIPHLSAQALDIIVLYAPLSTNA
jgi:hypothetical protein